MLINNVEIKTGDCIIACATEPGGYHFTLGFAFKVGDIVDGKTNGNILTAIVAADV